MFLLYQQFDVFVNSNTLLETSLFVQEQSTYTKLKRCLECAIYMYQRDEVLVTFQLKFREKKESLFVAGYSPSLQEGR